MVNLSNMPTPKKITIKDVKLLKTGTTPKGQSWALFEVIDNENNIYKTFSSAYQNKIGQEVEVEVEKQERNINGRNYINYLIVDRQKSAAEIRHEEIKKILKAIWEKLLLIEKNLNNN